MGLITKEVEVGVTAGRIKHYGDLGYEIPRVKNNKGKDVIPQGIKIKVRVEDLPKNSHIEVECECDICGENNTITYGEYNKVIAKMKDNKYRCKTCRMKYSSKIRKIEYAKSVGTLEDLFKQNNIDINKIWNKELNELMPNEISCKDSLIDIYLNCPDNPTHDIIKVKPLTLYKNGCVIPCKQCKHNDKLNGEVNFKYAIGEEVKTEKAHFIVTDRKVVAKQKNGLWRYRKYYKIFCLKCGFDSGEHFVAGDYVEEYWANERKDISCPCCCSPSKIVVKGINDIGTTHPHLVKYFKNKEDANKYTVHSEIKVDMICPDCNETVPNYMIAGLDRNHGLPCNCKDKVSYPEKFMYSLLKQLNIDFIWQYSRTHAEWCNDKRYDFYFELNGEKYIIETHGLQHYEENNNFKMSLQEVKENDKSKEKLALKNDINYIVLDCRYSNENWIINNILKSELNNIFDLSNIDWEEIKKYSIKNLIKEICEYYENNKPINTETIGQKYDLSSPTICKYLNKGRELGFCDYNGKANKNKCHAQKLSPVKIYNKTHTQLISICKNPRQAEEYILNNFNEKVSRDTIFRCCSGVTKRPQRFYFECATKEEYEEYNKNIK